LIIKSDANFFSYDTQQLEKHCLRSIMPQGMGLTDKQLNDQWEQFDWIQGEKRINGLQTRITKAAMKKDRDLVNRL